MGDYNRPDTVFLFSFRCMVYSFVSLLFMVRVGLRIGVSFWVSDDERFVNGISGSPISMEKRGPG